MADQGAGDGDALLLTAGQIARPAFAVRREADPLQQCRGAALPFRLRQAFTAKPDIVADVQPGQQARLLEHRADRRVGASDHHVVQPDFPARRLVQPGHETQQRRLAAARASQDGDDFAGAGGDLDTAQGLGAVGIGLADLADGQFRHRLVRAVVTTDSAPSSQPAPRRVLPAQQRHTQCHQHRVGGFAQKGKTDHRHQDGIGAAHLLAVEQQIAEAF